jgi:hypothetical protein
MQVHLKTPLILVHAIQNILLNLCKPSKDVNTRDSVVFWRIFQVGQGALELQIWRNIIDERAGSIDRQWNRLQATESQRWQERRAIGCYV